MTVSKIKTVKTSPYMAKDGSLIFLMSRGFESLYIPQVSQPGVYFAASSLSATKMHSFHGQFPNFLLFKILLNPNATFFQLYVKAYPRPKTSVFYTVFFTFIFSTYFNRVYVLHKRQLVCSHFSTTR